MTDVKENGVELPDSDLWRKFDVPAPRYTSYPTADRFRPDVGRADYENALAERPVDRPLSVYAHIPFCANVCFYCGCNKVVTRNRALADPYIDTVLAEAKIASEHLTGKRTLSQLHWGGGTPTFLDSEQIERLLQGIRAIYPFEPDGEYSIEIDARTCPAEKIDLLRRLGFNRMSLGVQDFNLSVLEAVNRVQSFELIRDTLVHAREVGFHSVNMDLIYGLPRQTRQSFAETIDKVIELSPDRIALYHYAHLPNIFKPQRRIVPEELPSASERVNMMFDSIRTLTANGYRYIGMDHFAKETDELSVAQKEGTIQRNFQGYSTRAECDMIALGASSISYVGNTYACNPREIEPYAEAIGQGHLATCRGFVLSSEDLLRRTVIMTIMCRFQIIKAQIEEQFGIDFDKTFAYELKKLQAYAKHDLVELTPETITVSAKGKIFVRAVAMQFDRYLRESNRAGGYSKIA
ncbi:MAG: oxygen-independent coproporphyrinogen III oxidase [Sutterella sp.]|nr:oxygen-independent coproporphyrinogen III oxidase [Sutterella sp.]